MTLEEARAALVAEILGGGAALANEASSCANVPDERALQQIVGSCFVKLRQLRLLQCDTCEKVFLKRSHLMTHYFDTHVNEDLKESDITTGDTSIDMEKTPNLTYMWRKDRKNWKLHQCNICDESFPFKADLSIHKLKHSGKEPQILCEICPKLFLNKTSLNIHTQNCHATENPLYLCDVCGKRFDALSYLMRHKNRHSDIKPYSCEFCKKKFAVKETMKSHRRTHTGETPYKCVCGRKFPYHSGLKNHHCTYIDQTQPSNRYLQCNYCNKKCQYRSSLINHIRIHLNTQKYPCSYCNAKFNSPCNLKRHAAKHTGNLPFTCGICNSKFVDKSKLSRHMITHRK